MEPVAVVARAGCTTNVPAHGIGGWREITDTLLGFETTPSCCCPVFGGGVWCLICG
jgi:hypothetical protein